jgi:hypothetical protein
MELKVNLNRLLSNKPPKHFNNFIVMNLDPLAAGNVLPREIEVRAPDADGARMLAVWTGFPALTVGDVVRVRRDTTDTQILVIEGTGGNTATVVNQSTSLADRNELMVAVRQSEMRLLAQSPSHLEFQVLS